MNTLSRSKAGCLFALAGIFLFSAAAQSASEQTLYAFCAEKKCKDGDNPYDLSMDSSGIIYGTTQFGGAYGNGTIYRFDPATGVHQVLYDFCAQPNCPDGRRPFRVKLVIDTGGNLYGTAAQGGNSSDRGVAFELIEGEAGWQYKTLYEFCASAGCTDGGIPTTGLTYVGASSGAPYDGQSALYGTTEFDGANGRGIVFQLKPSKSGAWHEKVLYTFCPGQDQCPDGLFPRVPLYADAQGRLFGATEIGGKHGNGVVFQLTPKSHHFRYEVIHHFCAEDSCLDGAGPLGGLTMESSGALVGTTTGGGQVIHGLLYKLTPRDDRRWTYNILTTFDANMGMRPMSLVLGADGTLFGNTAGGGTGFGGTIFRFDGTLQTLYDFCSERRCTDGASPDGLIKDSEGNLLGIATMRGTRPGGTIFKLTP